MEFFAGEDGGPDHEAVPQYSPLRGSYDATTSSSLPSQFHELDLDFGNASAAAGVAPMQPPPGFHLVSPPPPHHLDSFIGQELAAQVFGRDSGGEPGTRMLHADQHQLQEDEDEGAALLSIELLGELDCVAHGVKESVLPAADHPTSSLFRGAGQDSYHTLW